MTETEIQPNPHTLNDPYQRPLNPEWIFYSQIIGVSMIGLLGLWLGCSMLESPKDSWTTFIGGVVSLCIVIAMIVQIRVSMHQWHAMRASLRLSEDMFDVSERAYLAIMDINIQGETLRYGLNDTFVFDLLNGGKTPAFNVRVKTNPTLLTDELGDGQMAEIGSSLKPVEILRQIHLAGRTETFSFSPGSMLPEDAEDRWRRGEVKVFVPIQVAYEDIRRDTQFLVYWYEFIPQQNPVLRRPLRLQVHKRTRSFAE